MKPTQIKSITLIILLFSSVTSYGSEKISDGSFPTKEVVAGLSITTLAGLLFYKRHDIINKIWYTIFSPHEEALYEACKNKDSKAVQYLLPLPTIDPHTKDKFGCTPLHSACKEGNLEKVKFLLKNNPDINAQDNEKYTPIHHACINGHGTIVKL